MMLHAQVSALFPRKPAFQNTGISSSRLDNSFSTTRKYYITQKYHLLQKKIIKEEHPSCWEEQNY